MFREILTANLTFPDWISESFLAWVPGQDIGAWYRRQGAKSELLMLHPLLLQGPGLPVEHCPGHDEDGPGQHRPRGAVAENKQL